MNSKHREQELGKRHHERSEIQAANEVEEKWREMRADFSEARGFDLSFPSDQPRQILIATMMGRM